MSNAEIINKDPKEIYIAVDIGGTFVKIGFCADPSGGGWICKSSIPTDTSEHGKNILNDIADELLRLFEEEGIRAEQIAGLGAGVPGPVIIDRDGRCVVNGCVNLGWTGVIDAAGQLQELTGIKRISLVNDANAAALGEFHFGGGSQDPSDPKAAPAGSAVMVTLGTGIGGGIVQEGKIINGAFGAAGEIGHMPVNPDHPFLKMLREHDPSIPEHEDLEFYASATGVARMASYALDIDTRESVLRRAYCPGGSTQAELGELPPDKVAFGITAREVFNAAKAGDELALSVTDFFFDTLGKGLAAVSSVIDPDMYIIGGGAARAGAFLEEGLQKAYREAVFPPSQGTKFRLAELGNDAGLLGALVPLLI